MIMTIKVIIMVIMIIKTIMMIVIILMMHEGTVSLMIMILTIKVIIMMIMIMKTMMMMIMTVSFTRLSAPVLRTQKFGLLGEIDFLTYSCWFILFQVFENVSHWESW